MRVLDTDYIELESRRRAQLIALQWQEVTRNSKKERRRAHLRFVSKVFFISLLFFLIAATQWWFITEFKEVQILFVIYNYVILAVVFVQFLFLTFLEYTLRYYDERPTKVIVTYLLFMAQFCSITLARPTVEAELSSFVYAGLLTLSLWTISFTFAVIGHMEWNRSPAHLSLWSQKYYLTTSACLIITMEFNFMAVQVSIALFLIFFISIFFIIFGHSIGSVKFFREEAHFASYYILLHYLNMLSLMGNAIVFIERITDKNVVL